jgi:hypothetical protein
MLTVFWLESDAPRAQRFETGALDAALAFAESLRARRRGGEPVAFVTVASEDPGRVGEGGVADPPADYAWVKRRPAPGRRMTGR